MFFRVGLWLMVMLIFLLVVGFIVLEFVWVRFFFCIVDVVFNIWLRNVLVDVCSIVMCLLGIVLWFFFMKLFDLYVMLMV